VTHRELGPAADITRAAERRRYAWRVLSVTSLGSLLSAANTSTLDVGLPVVARHFHATATEAAWMLLSYMVVNTVMILVFGRLADTIGRRRLYQFGLAVLTLSSLLCGLAPDAVVLDVLRAVQGTGSAAVITNTVALLTDAFPADLLSVGVGLSATVVASAQVLGPLVGGAMASLFGWRAVFWFNVPTGIVGLVWAARTLRKEVRTEAREPFDVAGAVLWSLSLGGAVLALAQGGALGWGNPAVLVGAGLFVVGAPVFLAVQRHKAFPMLDLSLFAERERSLAYLAGFLLSMARFAVVLLVGLYVQAAGRTDPLGAGVRVVPMAVGMLVAAPLSGVLTRRYSARLLSTTGLVATTAGLFALAFVIRPTVAPAAIAGCLLAIGVGQGLFQTPNTSAILAGVRPQRRGIANGVRSMAQNTGYVTSTALALALVTSGLAAPEKRAAYAGTLSALSPDGMSTFTADYRIALLVFGTASAAATVASFARNRPRAA
jgi:EmrB/QacA subfamily drug resistance transporter